MFFFSGEKVDMNGQEFYDLAVKYDKGINVEKDKYKAFEYCKMAADLGHADAMNSLGWRYRNGVGIEKDPPKAFEYFQKSSTLKETGSNMNNLGICYREGFGVEKDENKAFICYQKSADLGSAYGLRNLGSCYHHGIGVKKDEQKAFNSYKKSANIGGVTGIFDVGFCYENGIGVEKDVCKAFEYYTRAEKLNNAIGICKVGHCYEKGVGVDKNIDKAIEYYEKSAKMGNDEGLKSLERCYREGIGTSLLWIPYEDLQIVDEIGQGGFATIYLAKWYQTKDTEIKVAIKLIHDVKFLAKLRAYSDIGLENPEVFRCHGISKNEKNNYILVLRYAEIGSLRENLNVILQMKWKDKLKLLRCITSNLEMIHSQEFIHQDLHSGNVLLESFHNAHIADLGLTILSHTKKNDTVFGVLPYVAPEVLQGKPFTQAGDIYSLGIIMWEMLTGQRPFDGHEFNTDLVIKICNGLRPEFTDETPKCYVELVKRCMHSNPRERPNARLINLYVNIWIDEVLNSDNENEIKKQFSESDKIFKQITPPQHSNLIYISKAIQTQEIVNLTEGCEIEIGSISELSVISANNCSDVLKNADS